MRGLLAGGPHQDLRVLQLEPGAQRRPVAPDHRVMRVVHAHVPEHFDPVLAAELGNHGNRVEAPLHELRKTVVPKHVLGVGEGLHHLTAVQRVPKAQ